MWCCGWQHSCCCTQPVTWHAGVGASTRAGAWCDGGVCGAAKHQDRAAASARGQITHQQVPGAQPSRYTQGRCAPGAIVLAVCGKQPPACLCAPQAASIMCAWRWLTCGRACRPSPPPACACWTRNPRSARTATRCVVAGGLTQWQGRAAQPISLLYCGAGGVPAPQGQRWRADGAGGGRARVTRGGDGSLYTTESLALTAGCTNVVQ